MNTAQIKVATDGHKGVLTFTVEFVARQEGDLQVEGFVNKKLSDENRIWKFPPVVKDKTRMVFRPKRCFDQKLLTQKQLQMDVDRNTWQHPWLFTTFFSNDGC